MNEPMFRLDGSTRRFAAVQPAPRKDSPAAPAAEPVPARLRPAST